MKFHPVANMDEAIKEAFGKKFKARKNTPTKVKTGNKRITSRRPGATTLN